MLVPINRLPIRYTDIYIYIYIIEQAGLETGSGNVGSVVVKMTLGWMSLVYRKTLYKVISFLKVISSLHVSAYMAIIICYNCFVRVCRKLLCFRCVGSSIFFHFSLGI